MFNDDVIVAIATAKAESAIGIIRMSGEGSLKIADKIFKGAKSQALSDFTDRRITYGHIVNGDKVYDEVMALYMLPPRTYTKEEIVEIYTHGNYAVMQEILQLLVQNGARVAEAGEFTKRAFLNGRLDLSQAEAVMDMISAKTKEGFTIAQNQLDGKYSKQIDEICEQLTDLMAQIEVSIDYPDEDIEMIAKKEIQSQLESIKKQIDKFMSTYNSGKIIKEGLKISIIGRANAGKSSLLNAILREDKAIVTHIEGTTRDVIEEYANINGIPVILMDTAGIRDTEDYIEKIGIEKSKSSLNSADLVILVMDVSKEFEFGLSEELFKDLAKPKLLCLNKIDLKIEQLEEKIEEISKQLHLDRENIIEMSVIEDRGIDELNHRIEKLVLSENFYAKESSIVTNIRHFEAFHRAGESVKNAIMSLEMQMPLDIIELDLTEAYEALGEIVGKSVSTDVINRIFQKFCLGK